MNRPAFLTALLLAFAGAGTLPGCKPDVAQSPDVHNEEAPPDPLAGLSDEARAAVLAQRICPVTEEPLGSMGAPIAVDVEGRTVYICCEHCRESLEADPAKYLAILDGANGGASEKETDATN